MQLSSIIPRNKSGPQHSFSQFDIPRAIFKLEKRIGRQKLANYLGIGEGSVRTILNYFEKNKLVNSTPMGSKLSEKGFELLSQIKTKVIEAKNMKGNYLTFNKNSFVLSLQATGVSNLAMLRDLAVMEGALGATILVYKNKHYIIPKEPKGGVPIPKHLQDKFKQNSLIILTYGGKQNILERAAWRIASKIINL